MKKHFVNPSWKLLCPPPTYSGRHNPLVVVRVDAHIVNLEVERILAVLDVLQLVLMQVGPPPQAGVHNVGEPFSSGNLATEHRMDNRKTGTDHIIQPLCH